MSDKKQQILMLRRLYREFERMTGEDDATRNKKQSINQSMALITATLVRHDESAALEASKLVNDRLREFSNFLIAWGVAAFDLSEKEADEVLEYEYTDPLEGMPIDSF